MKIHSDFSDFIDSLNRNKVEYVMVGAFNLAFLGFPRFTGDMDIWIRPTSSNACTLIKAIEDFGMKSLGLKEEDILFQKTYLNVFILFRSLIDRPVNGSFPPFRL